MRGLDKLITVLGHKRDISLIDGLTERECLASYSTVLLAYLPV